MVDPAEKDYTGPTSAYTAPEEQPRPDERTKVYGLVRHLVEDLATLVRKELALAAAEVNMSVQDTKKGVSGMISGAVVLNSGYLVLLAAATLGLAQVMEAWLAALIVGGITTVIGLIMVQSGKKKLEPSSFTPDRTLEEMRKDRDAVKGVKA